MTGEEDNFLELIYKVYTHIRKNFLIFRKYVDTKSVVQDRAKLPIGAFGDSQLRGTCCDILIHL
jgi:hypothetical protein